MADVDDTQVSGLIEELSGASRRRRQEVAHQLAIAAKAHPQIMLGHVDALVDALYRPEAQTRWEVLDALVIMVPNHAKEVGAAFEGAEAALFDELSSTLRLSAFTLLSTWGATERGRSKKVWPVIDEAIQCYHGDAEYRDMLVALLGLARGSVSDDTRQALATRVRFDAESGSGYIRSFSAEILQALE